MNEFPVRARAAADAVRRDQSIAFALLLLLALVFAPVIGLHVAVASFGAAPAAPDGVAAAPSDSKPSRG
ncbi:hypothetical protein [Methylobacterium sp. ID0610]|uniref:hypothetical protein n=1 Tax=Methylobacterium carpenticola TaxID=3344827 RepID=UPI0036797043